MKQHKKTGGLVYSTESGRICPQCRQPATECRCRRHTPAQNCDGIVRIRREVKGRGGKTVTTISGLAMQPGALQQMAAKLKKRCGSGGSVKYGTIIIQGDHRQTLQAELQSLGYVVKLAGG